LLYISLHKKEGERKREREKNKALAVSAKLNKKERKKQGCDAFLLFHNAIAVASFIAS
jgi:hypothetical protein